MARTAPDEVVAQANCALSSADITGQRFFLLTAKERVGHNYYGWLWLCVCKCGRTREVLFNHLKSAVVKYCATDCPARAKLLKKAEAAAKLHAARPGIQRQKVAAQYTNAKKKAKREGIDFNLTFEQWAETRPAAL